MEWFNISEAQILGIIASVFALHIILMVLIRINGLRSFSKMSAHDFAVTVAIGSVMASTVVAKDPAILQGALAIAMLLLSQNLYSRWRIASEKSPMENSPLLIMDGSEILYDNLKHAKITENDLIAKLREANVLNMSEVQAVIFEATGDISVLHGDKKIDEKLLSDVRKS